MKKGIPKLFAIVVLISIVITRHIVAKYGEGSRLIIIAVALVIALIGLLGIMFTKNLKLVLGTVIMLIPLAVMAIGIFINNIYISAAGLLLIFILIPIMIKMINIKNK